MKRVVVIFVVLCAALSVGLWLKLREIEAAKSAPSGGSGVIEGIEVDVAARMASRIVAVRVREGDRVHRGQTLVELDCREPQAVLAAAQARLRASEGSAGAARAQIDAALGAAQAAAAGIQASGAQFRALQATKDVTARTEVRMRKLQGEGGATASDLDRASTQVNELGERIRALQAQSLVARGQAAAARAQAAAARGQAEAAVASVSAAKADVLRSQVAVEECTLPSTIEGAVLTRSAEPGEVALPGGILLTLVRLDEVETVFYIPNAELAQAAPGKGVTVVADAYPKLSFHGEIRAVSDEAEYTPRNVQTREDRDRLVYAVRVLLKNPSGKLRPGMPVDVRIDGSAGGAR
jgi:HlyD family secretion protein